MVLIRKPTWNTLIQNNDDKLSFKSIHTLVVLFLSFANCFDVSHGDKGILFDDGN